MDEAIENVMLTLTVPQIEEAAWGPYGPHSGSVFYCHRYRHYVTLRMATPRFETRRDGYTLSLAIDGESRICIITECEYDSDGTVRIQCYYDSPSMEA